MIIEVFVGIPGLSDVEIGGSIAADPFEKRKAKNTSRLRISMMKTVMRFFISRAAKIGTTHFSRFPAVWPNKQAGWE